MLCGNKSSTTSGELYSTRKQIINFFLNDSENFSLYGPGWNFDQIPVYKGQVPYKYDVLKQHRFNFCLENIQGEQGYITEKIFDAFEAGCIPIYLGSSNISQYVPSHCYVDYSQFKCLTDLKKFMQNFTEEDYNVYLNNIQNYLKSKAAEKFSEDVYVKVMLKEIRALVFNK